ncbi:MAG: hypothetical protein B7Z55_14440, partial [Planctomycetales bacterium 12-60-4]
FPQWGIVAVQQSSFQVAVRSLHKVLGLITFMATVVAIARVWHALPRPRSEMTPQMDSMSLVAGGVA